MTEKETTDEEETELHFASKEAKIGHAEPKIFSPLLIVFLYIHWYTVAFALVIISFLYFLSMKGYSFNDFIRRAKVILSGNKRTQSTRWKRYF